MESVRGMRAALAVLAAVAAGSAQADDMWNCGGAKIVEIGMSQDDVLANCGEPSSKVADPQAQRAGRQVTGQTTMERWSYATDTLTTVLTFDQGRLIAIDTTPSQ